MKKNILRTSIISLMMFIISAIPLMAQTKKYSYDLVVGGSETKYVATKAGGSSFENKYYVTQDFVAQPTGSTRYFSYHSRYKGNQVSNGLKLAENDRKQHNNTYHSGKAVANKSYKLYCKCTGNGHTTSKSTVTGKWTP